MSRKQDLRSAGWIHLAQDTGPLAGSNEHVNEPSVFIKGGEFLNQLRILLASEKGLSFMEIFSSLVKVPLKKQSHNTPMMAQGERRYNSYSFTILKFHYVCIIRK
jgi:hypothetical protein